MSLTVQTIVDSLKNVELYGTAISKSTDNTRILSLINHAVGTFYKRFLIRQKSVWLQPQPMMNEYLLQGQQFYLFQGDKAITYNEPIPSPGWKAYPEQRWSDDLERVYAVFRQDGRKMSLNLAGSRDTVYLSAYNILNITNPQSNTCYQIIYDIKAPYLTQLSDDTGLPETAITALRCHVAKDYFLSIGTDEGITKNQLFSQNLANELSMFEEINQLRTKELPLSNSIRRGKWV